MFQVLFDLVLFAGLCGTWMRLLRPQKDDPRLSRGLQLLQSKISVLEDLSDRTEIQVKQLTALVDQKTKEVQRLLSDSQFQQAKIENSMAKSLEIAQIFQDKIPHEEIMERQHTIKYVQAAKLANQGANVETICQQVDLPKGEVEFIAKINRNQLMFAEDELPAWVNASKTLPPSPTNNSAPPAASPLPPAAVTATAHAPPPAQPIDFSPSPKHAGPSQELSKLGEQFRAVTHPITQHVAPEVAKTVRDVVTFKTKNSTAHSAPRIYKVQFPRIEQLAK